MFLFPACKTRTVLKFDGFTVVLLCYKCPPLSLVVSCCCSVDIHCFVPYYPFMGFLMSFRLMAMVFIYCAPFIGLYRFYGAACVCICKLRRGASARDIYRGHKKTGGTSKLVFCLRNATVRTVLLYVFC